MKQYCPSQGRPREAIQLLKRMLKASGQGTTRGVPLQTESNRALALHWRRLMKIEVYSDADAVARQAAKFIAAEARAAVASHGSFVMAVSGGRTPWIMLRDLAHEEVPWNAVHVVQVDERIAPAGDPDRNLTHLRE